MMRNADVRKRLFLIFAPVILAGTIVFVIVLGLKQTYPQLAAYQVFLPMLAGVFVFCVSFAAMSWFRSLSKSGTLGTDVSHWQTPIPDNRQFLATGLDGLDFSMIGLLSYRQNEDKLPDAWLFADKQGTTLAILRQQGSLVFFSIFGDGFTIASSFFPQTNYLDGHENIQINQQYATHQRKLDKARAAHGDPASLASLEDYINWENDYGLEHRVQNLRKVALMFSGAALFMASLLVQAIILVTKTFLELPQIVVQISAIAPLLIAAVVIFLLFKSGMISINRPTMLDKR